MVTAAPPQSLLDTVWRNCHIADARHGADYGMCTYLLKMREFYRWEQGFAFDAALSKDEVGDWLVAREALWEELADAEFGDVEVGSQRFDRFDTAGINAAIEPLGLVYSAGLVHGARPNFFLGRLERRESPADGFDLWLSGAELARCLNSPPAMNAGRSIFLRRESLRRYLWEKLESWRWSRPDNAFGRALACYPFDSDVEVALETMTENELAAAREHEIGEYLAGQLLGDAWNDMLFDLSHSPAELMARAVRDHLADCSRTLPMLVEDARAPSIHFFAGNFSAMRKQLFPSLDAAYRQWLDDGDLKPLAVLAGTGAAHFAALAEDMLVLHAELGPSAAKPIAALVESRIL
jgi:hypothetical protein